MPVGTLPLRVERIPLAGARVDAEVRAARLTVDGLPEGFGSSSPIRPADPPGHGVYPRFHLLVRCVRIGSDGCS